jgi:hypothetical protein
MDRIRDKYTEARFGRIGKARRIAAEAGMAAQGRLSVAELDTVEVIVPNLSLRYSGVTATNRMTVPRIAAMMKTVWLGRDAPDDVPRIGWSDLWRLRRPVARRRIWHARRNIEMVVGVLLRALGWCLPRRRSVTTRR